MTGQDIEKSKASTDEGESTVAQQVTGTVQAIGQTVGGVAEKVAGVGVSVGVGVATGVRQGAGAAIKGIQDAAREARIALYSPVFPEQYRDPDFDLPRTIVIVDGDQRKNIDVCEGAIGWLSKNAGMEVLHLYESFVPDSGLRFHPVALCDAAYCVDPFDAARYVNLDAYFETMQQDKVTELRNVAYELGAKSCRLESYCEESNASSETKRATASLLPVRASGDELEAHGAMNREAERLCEIVFSATFEENAAPRRPKLGWYRNDREILSLIEIRCSGDKRGTLGTYDIKLSSTASATMSIEQASKLRTVLRGMKISCGRSLEREARNEQKKSLRYIVEF